MDSPVPSLQNNHAAIACMQSMIMSKILPIKVPVSPPW